MPVSTNHGIFYDFLNMCHCFHSILKKEESSLKDEDWVIVFSLWQSSFYLLSLNTICLLHFAQELDIVVGCNTTMPLPEDVLWSITFPVPTIVVHLTYGVNYRRVSNICPLFFFLPLGLHFDKIFFSSCFIFREDETKKGK